MRRKYRAPQTPLQRLTAATTGTNPAARVLLANTQSKQDPFALSTDIEDRPKNLSASTNKTQKRAA